VADKLFTCTQIELPYPLGPPDGRYVLRASSGEPQHVLVLRTATGRRPGRSRPQRRRSAHSVARGERPVPEVTLVQATVIDAVPVSTEAQAHRWLADLHQTDDVRAAFAVLDRVRLAHRIASANAAVGALDPSHALAIRAGFGSGAQVADGHLAHARELPTLEPRAPGAIMRIVPVPGRRTRLLRPQEHFAALLARRAEPMLCQELALRARADFDHGRLRHAALELDHAYAAALHELPVAGPGGEHLAELRELAPSVSDAAEAALPGAGHAAVEPDAQLLRRALARLEAALREQSGRAS
jgi:hypothetical protein